MNYLTHALPYLDDAAFLAGTALPDWLSVVDRKLRVRPVHLTEPSASADPLLQAFARGAQQHLDDDGWFHSTRAFNEVTAELGLLFRTRWGSPDGFRCGFLAHIVLELLIDAELAERYPAALDVYYTTLATIDPGWIEATASAILGKPATKLGWFVELFQREAVLRDYADDDRLCRRLNQVLSRVKLSPLPVTAPSWMAEARPLVRQRLVDLLPPALYPWPETFDKRSLP